MSSCKKLYILTFLGIIVAVLLAAYYLVSLKTEIKLLKKQNKNQELLLDNRTKELSKVINDKVQAQNWVWSNDSELEKIANDFFKNGLNYNRSQTPLCSIMSKENSDKAPPAGHNYTQLYYALFKDKQNASLNIFEVGLDTNNTDLLSNMGANGTPGASLRGWRNFFPNSMVYGADVDKRILFTEDRIKTYYVDQLKADTISAMWSEIGNIEFDVILDDGLHTYDANTIFLENSLTHLKKDGIYIIEDIGERYVDSWKEYILKNNYHAVIIELPDYYGNHAYDNRVILIKKL